MLEPTLKTTVSTSSQVPHSTALARAGSPRSLPGVDQAGDERDRAAGSSQPMSRPKAPVSSRSQPAGGGGGI